MSRRMFFLTAIGLALAAVGSAGALAPSPDAVSQTKLFADDNRLSQKVTIRATHIYLGELLEQLSRDTRVPLTVDDTKGPVSGIQLTCFAKDLTLRQIMDGLVQLFSHQHDRWEWQVRSGGRKGYVLRHQHSPQEAVAAARAEILNRWTADVRSIHAIARMPNDAREARARLRSDLFPPGAVNWSSMDLLAELTKSELDALLSGRQIALDRTRLTPRGQAAFDHAVALVRSGTHLVDGKPVVPPAEVSFYISWNTRYIGPVLWRQTGGTEATNAVGGSLWDTAWLGSQGSGWRNVRDPARLEFTERRAARDPSVGRQGGKVTVAEWMREAAEKQGLNVLADWVFPHYRTTVGSWHGTTRDQTILALTGYDFPFKQVGELYLVRHSSAEVHLREHLVPWPYVKALRRAADHNGGYLDFDQLLKLVEVTDAQLNGLGEEFPDVSLDRIQPWRPVLKFFLSLDENGRRRARTKAGLPYHDAGLIARHTLETGPSLHNVPGLGFLAEHRKNATVSLRVESLPESPEERRQLVWEIQAPGTNGHRAVLIQKPRIPLGRAPTRGH